MTPAVFVHLKRSTQNAAGRDENGFTGWSRESPAAAFCCSHVQKHTNCLKFTASAFVKCENDSIQSVPRAKEVQSGRILT